MAAGVSPAEAPDGRRGRRPLPVLGADRALGYAHKVQRLTVALYEDAA